MDDFPLFEEDYVALARYRDMDTLYDISLLQVLIDDISAEEIQYIKEIRRKRREYSKDMTVVKLRTYLKERGIKGISKMSKSMLIDAAILADENGISTYNVTLDEDQQKVVDRWNDKLLLVSAGPGSGKTTTLCKLAKKITEENPQARVLVLAYNRNAKATLHTRFSALSIPDIAKHHCNDVDHKGCCILTINEFGYQVGVSINVDMSLLVDNNHFSDGAYRKQLEFATKRLHNQHWDYFIVDEAQDLLDAHAALIEAVMRITEHTFIAGDPRQELYNGARWYSHMWTKASKDVKLCLRYNHRSSAEIVHMLNRYSKMNFPTLHHDQICATTNSGRFEIILHSQHHAREISNLLTSDDGNNAYAISPITINKFHMDKITGAIRQYVYELKPGCHANPLSEDNNVQLTNDEHLYHIGTAKKLKGTERRTVVVYGLEPPYTNYNVSKEAFIKHIFVAISRAKSNLYIVLATYLSDDNPLACLLNRNYITQSPSITVDILNYYEVKSDICKLIMIEPEVVAQGKIADPVCLQIEYDADFIGSYIETSLMVQCGIPVNDVLLEMEDKKKGHFIGLHMLNSILTFTYPREMDNIMQQYKSRLMKTNNKAYIYAAMQYTANIGTPWIISERINKPLPPDMLLPYIEKMEKYLGCPSNQIKYQQKVYMYIMNSIGLNTKTTIIGKFDFSANGKVIEIKYVNNISNEHRRQIAIYATMINAPIAMLINVRSGEYEIIKAIDNTRFNLICRAHGIISNAKNISNICKGRLSIDNIYTECCIAVATNTVNNGAIAFNIGTGELIDVYYDIADGFTNWIHNISETRSYLVWGSKTFSDGNTIDVSKLYKTTPLFHIINRISNRLLKFKSKSVFEEALMIAVVAIIISNFEGTV